jgi:predicted metal-dependent enzyme (double-stranded beta helix superfamily)
MLQRHLQMFVAVRIAALELVVHCRRAAHLKERRCVQRNNLDFRCRRIKKELSHPSTKNRFSFEKGDPLMFELEAFTENCRSALGEKNPHSAVRDIVAKAVSQPQQVLRSFGEPKLSDIQTLYRSENLTILNVLWGPGMSLYPHDHRMWAVIGIYSGREDNSFYRRSETGLVVQGGKTLDLKDTIPLGEAVIHSVTNPLNQITAAIHVYGGDFFTVPRSE